MIIARIKWHRVAKFLGDTTATCGALWLLLSPLGVWVPAAKPSGITAYILFLFAGLAVACCKNRRKELVNIVIPETDSEITVEIGDIFEGKGLKFISVNEYFDCKLGDHVSEESLHGQFIKRVMKGDEDEWRRAVSSILPESCRVAPDVERESGEKDQYKIGTIARMKSGGPEQEYILVALTRTNIESLKASAELKDVCACAEVICEAARRYAQGRRVDIPIIGSGLSNTGLPPARLLDILILFVVYYTQKQEIAKQIRIVVSDKLRGRLDLKETQRRWTQK